MNCDKCKEEFIKVNTFCFPLNSDRKSFVDNGVNKHCEDYNDDETGKKLGLIENQKECIIKPDNYYLQDNLLKECIVICGKCENSNTCLNCINNFVLYYNPNECRCPSYFGTEKEEQILKELIIVLIVNIQKKAHII